MCDWIFYLIGLAMCGFQVTEVLMRNKRFYHTPEKKNLKLI